MSLKDFLEKFISKKQDVIGGEKPVSDFDFSQNFGKSDGSKYDSLDNFEAKSNTLTRIFKLFFIGFFVFFTFLVVFFVFAAKKYLPQIEEYISKLNLPSKQEILGQNENEENVEEYLPQTSQEEAIINAVKQYSPSVVSIIVSKDLPIIEEYYTNPFKDFFGPNYPFDFKIPQYRQQGIQKQQIGGGTGFIISEDGMILTNRHVVSDDKADYTVLTNDAKKFSAKVLARDLSQDLAILKIEKNGAFPVVRLGDSEKLQIGQTVIAIGNALAEFQNTVSVGVVSGLGRTITAEGGGMVETLEDVIQTDAAINKGNSGGPLLNLKGEVIGINTAMSLEGENIGFAIPINKAKKAIEQVKKTGKITYPFLGVRYVLVTQEVQEKNNLAVDYGALLLRGDNGEPAVSPGSSAQKAGLKEGDIILEFNKEKITTNNSLAKIIAKYNPGDKITLKILRDKKEIFIEIILGEKSE